MKATTEQLSKVDFSKCKLPDFRGLKVHAAKSPVGPFPYIEAEWYIPVATRSVDEPYTWDTRRATTEELAQIVAMCRAVDAFIATELAVIEARELKERTKPACGDGWEYCRKEEATEACAFSFFTSAWSNWYRNNVFLYSGPDDCYLFRRPIAKPEPMPCPSKMHIVQTQTVPHHGPAVVGIYTSLAEQYRGKQFRVTVEEL